MFTNGIPYNYNIDKVKLDTSLHGGIPRKFFHLKDKKFNDWEIPPWELYIFQDRLLGEGSFAKVYLAKWRETFVVAKVINPNVCNDKKELVLREFEIMTKMHHPNIVQFLGYIYDPFIIIMEYIPNGNLLENLNSIKKGEKKKIMFDILRGLAYIHNRQPYSLVHRDIKPTNILLTKSKVAKITDFGLSKFSNMERIYSNDNLVELDKEAIKESTTPVGTERYMAPEININGNYNNKVDIYSCGVLLYELFENKIHIPGIKMKWYYTPKKIKELIIEKMLNTNPEEREEAINLVKQFQLVCN